MSRASYSVDAMIADQWYRDYLRHFNRSIAREDGHCELCQEPRAATPSVTYPNVDAGDALSDVPTPLPPDEERRARLDRGADGFGGPINADAADRWCPDSPTYDILKGS